MRKRRKLSKRISRKKFSRHSGFHPRNQAQSAMRGGVRF